MRRCQPINWCVRLSFKSIACQKNSNFLHFHLWYVISGDEVDNKLIYLLLQIRHDGEVSALLKFILYYILLHIYNICTYACVCSLTRQTCVACMYVPFVCKIMTALRHAWRNMHDITENAFRWNHWALNGILRKLKC